MNVLKIHSTTARWKFSRRSLVIELRIAVIVRVTFENILSNLPVKTFGINSSSHQFNVPIAVIVCLDHRWRQTYSSSRSDQPSAAITAGKISPKQATDSYFSTKRVVQKSNFAFIRAPSHLQVSQKGALLRAAAESVVYLSHHILSMAVFWDS